MPDIGYSKRWLCKHEHAGLPKSSSYAGLVAQLYPYAVVNCAFTFQVRCDTNSARVFTVPARGGREDKTRFGGFTAAYWRAAHPSTLPASCRALGAGTIWSLQTPCFALCHSWKKPKCNVKFFEFVIYLLSCELDWFTYLITCPKIISCNFFVKCLWWLSGRIA